MAKNNIRKIKIPHVFIFLSIIILFCAVLTYIIPSGSFERTTRQYGEISQSVVIPGTYHEMPKHYSVIGLFTEDKREGKSSPISLLGLLTAIPKGMQQSAALIFFVFIVGAVFSVIIRTGTINAALFLMIEKFREAPSKLFFLIFLLLALLTSFLGVVNEIIPLVPLFLILAKEFGYDRMFGFALVSLPLFIGWSAAMTNPFNVTIAQQIAELPLGSGMGLRAVLFLVFFIVGFSYLMYYGRKVKNTRSDLVKSDSDFEAISSLQKDAFTKTHFWILATLLLGYMLIIGSVQIFGWGLVEMTGGFIGIGIVVIFISDLSGDDSMEAFVKGLETMIIPALVVGVARGISVVMQEGQIIDTILFHASDLLMTLPKYVAVEGMLLFQTVLNFFIPSASGQALVSMPLMTPLADLVGVSRQTGVLAYVLGDGLSNLIIPTNGVLMAMLGLASVSFEKWFRFAWPLFLILMGIGMLALFIAVQIGY